MNRFQALFLFPGSAALLAGALLCFAAVTPPVNRIDGPGLCGTATDAQSGLPLSGADITHSTSGVVVRTDSLGQYCFNGLGPGVQTLRIQLEGYIEQEFSIYLAGPETITWDLALEPAYIEPEYDELRIIESTGMEQLQRERKQLTFRSAPAPAMVAEDVEAEGIYLGYSPSVSPSQGKPSGGLKNRKGKIAADTLDFNTEEYDRITDNPFLDVLKNPLSTFSIDVDAASYANIRRYLDGGQQPPKDAVRIEELVNYFDYDYAQPTAEHPFGIYTEIAESPWNPGSHLVHIGIQGKDIDRENLDPSNLVFLLDVSGSMDAPNKLGLVKSSLLKLVDQLSEKDRVAIVVYAGAAGTVLPSTAASDKKTIREALNRLSAGGSTAGGAGIRLAYTIAEQNRIAGGNNRVILCTDGDFNVGASSDAEMVRLIEEKRKSGIFITVCGFGMGNYKDSKMEKIADSGNGNYYYIDREQEADKVFVAEMRSTLFTIASDVKLQIEFNPTLVSSYRLIGYENRLLAREDFDDDTRDAGELGAGHTVTALYEVVLKDNAEVKSHGDQSTEFHQQNPLPVDDLRYVRTTVKPEAYVQREILSLKMRYKKPGETTSRLILHPLAFEKVPLSASSNDFRWSAAVAAYGMILRDSPYKGDASLDMVLQLARGAKGADLAGYRMDFIRMISQTQALVSAR